jgi:uncharacterized OB-fold protein
MSAPANESFEKQLRSFVGKPIGEPFVARDPVNLPMIRQWCDAMGETHPAYGSDAGAAATVHREAVAPPTMLQAWIMEGWIMHEGYDEPRNEQHRLHKLLSEAGYSGVLGTNTEEHYDRYLKVGDVVTAETIIDEISEEKATGAGIGYFITTRTSFHDQEGEPVGWMSFRVLKFKPPPGQQPAAGSDEPVAVQAPTRMKPPEGHDNAWWWRRVAEDGVLPIQRCQDCKKLRHPPRPMCDACGSLAWDSIDACGRGSVHTYTVIHHPQVPGYDYPLVSVIGDLEEGERIVSTLVDCKPEDCRIGMRVEVVIHEDEDGFRIPLFRPFSKPLSRPLSKPGE